MAKAQTALKAAVDATKVVRAAQTAPAPTTRKAVKKAAPAPAPAPEVVENDDEGEAAGTRTIHILSYVGEDNKAVEMKFTRFSKAVKEMRGLLADGIEVTFSRDKAQVEQVIAE